MQYARVIDSRAFVEYGYGRPRGSPWIEFTGLATVVAKQYKKVNRIWREETWRDLRKVPYLGPYQLATSPAPHQDQPI